MTRPIPADPRTADSEPAGSRAGSEAADSEAAGPVSSAAVQDGTPRLPLGRRMTVRAWLLAVLGMTAVLVLGAAAASAALLSRTAQATDHLLDHTGPGRSQTYRLQAALLDQENGLRGYVITGDAEFLAPYTRGVAAERTATAAITPLIADDPRLTADLSAVSRAADTWRRDYAVPLIAQARRSGPGRTDRASIDRAKPAFDRVRTLFGTQSRDLEAAHAQGRADLAHARSVEGFGFTAIAVGFLLACLVLAVLLQMMVVRPLRSLRIASLRVADGEFGHRITTRGPVDLRSLAEDVEAMRRRIVTELQDSKEKEEQLVRQSTELRRSNGELEQFAYVASHDLQEPLRKVASFCQLLEKRYGDQLDERGVQYIAFAVDGARRMQVLINDLLTFSRVGRRGDDLQPVELGAAIDEALANLAAAVEESEARIVRPETLPDVLGDPMLLSMLWQNLLGNAVKFRSPGRAPVIRIEVLPAEEGRKLAVADNGIGIPEEFAEKVFVIFQRLHGRDEYGGTGIGLALCRKIVEHHGGWIRLDTSYTGGTRIEFTLPAPAADSAASASDPASGSPADPADPEDGGRSSSHPSSFHPSSEQTDPHGAGR